MVKSKCAKKTWWQRFGALLIGGTSLFALLVIFWQPILSVVLMFICFRCVNSVEETALSPDRKLKAVVLFHDCGAGVSFRRGVEVMRANDAIPDGDGNACTLGGSDEGYLIPRWKNNNELVIHNKSKSFSMPKQVTLWTGSGFTTVKIHRAFQPVR